MPDRALFAKLAPISGYLNKVQVRMFAKGWPPQDERFKRVREAHAAPHRLAIHTHDMACDEVMRLAHEKPRGPQR